MPSSGILALGLGVSIVLGTPAYSEDGSIVGASVFCDTAENMGRYLRAAEAGESDRILASSARAPASCVAGVARYYEREQIRLAREGIKTFRIMRITVVGVFRDGIMFDTDPHDRYSAVLEAGIAI
jgi:hypothetical protein